MTGPVAGLHSLGCDVYRPEAETYVDVLGLPPDAARVWRAGVKRSSRWVPSLGGEPSPTAVSCRGKAPGCPLPLSRKDGVGGGSRPAP